jgi:ketosteroid isomerase-like protein
MQLSQAWSALVATGDLEAVMAGWADDATMLPPSQPAL